MSIRPDNRRVRVFLSSTFSDMHSERNHLVKKVFPMIKVACRRRNIDFSVVDLRWGITEEESKTGRVIEICIDEIERTRPFFIGLLGGRYGWVPEEAEFEANGRLAQKYPWIRDCMDDRMSITEIEMQHGALKSPGQTNALFFIRREDTIASGNTETDRIKAAKLRRLKAAIRKAGAAGLCFTAEYATVKDLGSRLYIAMMARIDEMFPEEAADPNTLTDQRQRAIEAELRKAYTHSHVPVVITDIEDMDRHYLITGRSGIGKSAFVANWNAGITNDRGTEGIYLHEEGCSYMYDDTPGDAGEDKLFIPVIRTYIDNDINTIDKCFRQLLRRLSHIYPTLSADAALAPEDEMTDLATEFAEADFTDRIIWMVDGIERLIGEEQDPVAWINRLPDNITLIATTASEDIALQANMMEQEELRPLSATDVTDIVERRLAEHAKKLLEKQRMHIANSTILRTPSLLMMFLQELQEFGIYEELNSHIDHLLSADDETAFLNRILDSIESVHSRETVSNVLSLLVTATCGLPESGLIEALGMLPIEWSGLYGTLLPLTTETDGHISITSQALKSVITSRYLTDETLKADTRRTAIGLLEKENRWLSKQNRAIIRQEEGLAGVMLYDLAITAMSVNMSDSPYILSIRRNNTELIRLYRDNGDWKKIYSLLGRDRLYSMVNLSTRDMSRLLPELYVHGYPIISRHLSRRNIIGACLLSHYTDDTDYSQFTAYIYLQAACCRMLPEDIRQREIRNILKRSRLTPFIPKKLQRMIKEQFAEPSTACMSDSANIEDTWTPGRKTKLNDIISVYTMLETMASEERLKHILDKATAMTRADSTDDLSAVMFNIIVILCHIRLGQEKEASELIRTTLSTIGAEEIMLRIDILYSLTFGMTYHEDYELVSKKIERLRSHAIDTTTTNADADRYLFILRVMNGEAPDPDECMANIIRHTADCPEHTTAAMVEKLADQLSILEHNKEAANVYRSIENHLTVSRQQQARYHWLAARCLDKACDFRNARNEYSLAAGISRETGNTGNYVWCTYRAIYSLYQAKDYRACFSACEEAIKDESVTASDEAINIFNIMGLSAGKLIQPAQDKAVNKAWLDRAVNMLVRSRQLNGSDAGKDTTALNIVNIVMEHAALADAEQTALAHRLIDENSRMDAKTRAMSKCKLLEMTGNIEEAIATATEAIAADAFDIVYLAKLQVQSPDEAMRATGMETLITDFAKKLAIYLAMNGKTDRVTALINGMHRYVDEEKLRQFMADTSQANMFLQCYIYIIGVALCIDKDDAKAEAYGTQFVAQLREIYRLTHDEKYVYFYVCQHVKLVSLLGRPEDTDGNRCTAVCRELLEVVPDMPVDKLLDHDYIQKNADYAHPEFVKIIMERTAAADKPAGVLAGILKTIHDKCGTDTVITFFKTVAPEAARHLQTAGATEKADLKKIITTILYHDFDEEPQETIVALFERTGIRPILPIREEDFATPATAVAKYRAARDAELYGIDPEEADIDFIYQLMNHNCYEEAIELCDSHHVQISPDMSGHEITTVCCKADCLFTLGRYTEALEAYQAIYAASEESEGEFDLSDWRYDIPYVALCYIYTGRVMEALKFIDKAYAEMFADEEDNDFFTDTAKGYSEIVRATAYARQDLTADAQEIFDRINEKIEQDYNNLKATYCEDGADGEEDFYNDNKNITEELCMYRALFHIEMVRAYHRAGDARAAEEKERAAEMTRQAKSVISSREFMTITEL